MGLPAVSPHAMEAVRTRPDAHQEQIVAGLASTAEGCSYYPFSGSTLRTLAGEPGGYTRTKSSLHFDPAKGLPRAMVRKLIRARLAE